MNEPAPYKNMGAMNPLAVVGLVLATIGLVAANFFQFIGISYWLAATPLIYLYARFSLYQFFVNAFHQALHYDAVDASFESAAAITEEAERRATLNANNILASLRDDEMEGHA